MTTSISRLRSVLAALGVSALCVAALWLWAVPSALSPSTFAFMTVFMIGGATVSLITWRNAQPTSTVAHVLHATETVPIDATSHSKVAQRHTSL